MDTFKTTSTATAAVSFTFEMQCKQPKTKIPHVIIYLDRHDAEPTANSTGGFHGRSLGKSTT